VQPTHDKQKLPSNPVATDDEAELLPAYSREKRLLNPIDRISEILFGLIMALTFTCTISVVQTNRAEVRDMMFAAIGCNIAWGLVDAVMFILTGLAEKGRGKSILNFIRKTKHPEKARGFIADALPPVISSVMSEDQLEDIWKGLLKIPHSDLRVGVSGKDIKMALGIFVLVFLSTIPVALPFAFIDEVRLALRVSNGTAIILMFICGWMLAKYASYKKWMMGFAMILIGVILVAITIAMGG